MKTVVVLAQPKREGFNKAIALAAQNNFSDAMIIDLYADGFDPIMPAEELPRKFSFDEITLRYQEAISAADRIIFVHPDWWGGPPAILKGFLDRVFRPGVAYGFREADFKDAKAPGLFLGKRADVFITTDAVPAQNGTEWAPSTVWKENVLQFCGIVDSRVHIFWNLRESTYAQRKLWLDGVPLLLDAV